MTDIEPEDDPAKPEAERTKRTERDATATSEAWKRTVEEMRLLAEQRREDGWEVVPIVAGNTAPTSPEDRPDDRLGLVFVVPGSDAEPFTDAFDRGTFPEYEVYRNTVEGGVFLVVEYRDPEESAAILIAGQYRLERADAMVTAADREERMETHVQTLDGTVLGSFRHEEYEKFVPETATVVDELGGRGDSPAGE